MNIIYVVYEEFRDPYCSNVLCSFEKEEDAIGFAKKEVEMLKEDGYNPEPFDGVADDFEYDCSVYCDVVELVKHE